MFPQFKASRFNGEADPLAPEEAAIMREDPAIALRIVASYRIMLEFFGFTLSNPETGEVARNPLTWERRFSNLNTRSHNNLRISRILASLGQLGFRRYKAPLLKALREEIDGGKLPTCRPVVAAFVGARPPACVRPSALEGCLVTQFTLPDFPIIGIPAQISGLGLLKRKGRRGGTRMRCAGPTTVACSATQ